jgi:hypothetical protein
VPFDPSLDGSGWTPAALQLLMPLSSSAAFAKALALWITVELLPGITINPATVGNILFTALILGLVNALVRPYAEACQVTVRQTLEAKAFDPLTVGSKRRWVLEIDGVHVLGRAGLRGCVSSLGTQRRSSTSITPVSILRSPWRR